MLPCATTYATNGDAKVSTSKKDLTRENPPTIASERVALVPKGPRKENIIRSHKS